MESFVIILEVVLYAPKAVWFGVTEERRGPLLLSYGEENHVMLHTARECSVEYKAQL